MLILSKNNLILPHSFFLIKFYFNKSFFLFIYFILFIEKNNMNGYNLNTNRLAIKIKKKYLIKLKPLLTCEIDKIKQEFNFIIFSRSNSLINNIFISNKSNYSYISKAKKNLIHLNTYLLIKNLNFFLFNQINNYNFFFFFNKIIYFNNMFITNPQKLNLLKIKNKRIKLALINLRVIGINNLLLFNANLI